MKPSWLRYHLALSLSTKVSGEHAVSIFSAEVYTVYGCSCGQNANYQNSQISHFIIPRKIKSTLQVLYIQVQFLPLKIHGVSIKKPKCIKLCKNIIPVICMNET